MKIHFSLCLALLAVLGRNHSSGVAEKENSVIHSISILGQKQLAFMEGDDPCKALKTYCRSLTERGVPYDVCFDQLHPLMAKQLSSIWSDVRTHLNADPGLFIDCESFSLDHESFLLGGNGRIESAHSISIANTSAIIREMLTLLENATTSAMETFDIRSNERLLDWERLQLYSKAILLLPNNLYIVDQFGLALIYMDRESDARRLFSNAVARYLWGHPLQRPVYRYVPGLTAKPWHDKNDYPFIAKLEEGAEDIRAELLHNLRERRHLFINEQEHVGGDWKELRIKTPGYGFTKVTEFFPETMQAISECGQEFISVKFSAIKPGTHIRTHSGPSNERLRIHLTLLHSGGAQIRVGTDWRTWEEGKALIIDSSWEHEVMHKGDELRVVLIMDIWHPEVPLSQRRVY